MISTLSITHISSVTNCFHRWRIQAGGKICKKNSKITKRIRHERMRHFHKREETGIIEKRIFSLLLVERIYMTTMKSEEQKRLENLERIKNYRLLDDNFMTACFQKDLKAVELVIRIIMNIDSLIVKRVEVQKTIKNISGRSVRLDVFAVDSEGKNYNIEIQKTNDGAGAKRARHNAASLDSSNLQPGENVEILPETYIIFITEHDVLKGNLPIYHIERCIIETGEYFNDGTHIIYVNAEIQNDTPLGKLMYDFSCIDPEDMHYKELAKRVKFVKTDSREVENMCRAMELLREESIAEGRVLERAEILKGFFKSGMSDEDISRFSGVPLEEILEIKNEIAHLLK